MKRKRLDNIGRELAAMRRNAVGIKPGVLERIAKKLGRKRVKRGSEPNYGSPEVPDLGHPISIPHHSTLKPGTARSIIDALLSDVDTWNQHLDSIGDDAEEDDETHQENDDDNDSDTNESTE
jgi:hypothetical protein